jgi:hypothetical protein
VPGAASQVKSGTAALPALWLPTPTTEITHTTIEEILSGKNVDWMEKVSDEQYRLKKELHDEKPIGLRRQSRTLTGAAAGMGLATASL